MKIEDFFTSGPTLKVKLKEVLQKEGKLQQSENQICIKKSVREGIDDSK